MNSYKMKSVLGSVLGGAAITFSTAASAIVVGGVNFGNAGLLSHLESTTLAETLLTGNGQTLTGYGQVNTVNGDIFYATTPGYRLYFTFTNYVTTDFSATSTGFTGGVVNVYIGNTFNLLNQSSDTNLTLIEALTPWVRLTAANSLVNGTNIYSLSANGTLTGSALNFTGQGLLNVDLSGTFGDASVAAYLDSNGFGTGLGTFADIQLSSDGGNGGPLSAGLNRNDNIAGCADGTARAGQWCVQGSATLNGPTVVVPEPSSLALGGLALIALATSRRRRSSKKTA